MKENVQLSVPFKVIPVWNLYHAERFVSSEGCQPPNVLVLTKLNACLSANII